MASHRRRGSIDRRRLKIRLVKEWAQTCAKDLSLLFHVPSRFPRFLPGPPENMSCPEAHSSKYVQGNQNEKNKVTTSSHKDKSKDNNSNNTDNQRVTRGGHGVIKNLRDDDDETHNQKQHDPTGSSKKEECESSSNIKNTTNGSSKKEREEGQVFDIRCHTKNDISVQRRQNHGALGGSSKTEDWRKFKNRKWDASLLCDTWRKDKKYIWETECGHRK